MKTKSIIKRRKTKKLGGMLKFVKSFFTKSNNTLPLAAAPKQRRSRKHETPEQRRSRKNQEIRERALKKTMEQLGDHPHEKIRQAYHKNGIYPTNQEISHYAKLLEKIEDEKMRERTRRRREEKRNAEYSQGMLSGTNLLAEWKHQKKRDAKFAPLDPGYRPYTIEEMMRTVGNI